MYLENVFFVIWDSNFDNVFYEGAFVKKFLKFLKRLKKKKLSRKYRKKNAWKKNFQNKDIIFKKIWKTKFEKRNIGKKNKR